MAIEPEDKASNEAWWKPPVAISSRTKLEWRRNSESNNGGIYGGFIISKLPELESFSKVIVVWAENFVPYLPEPLCVGQNNIENLLFLFGINLGLYSIMLGSGKNLLYKRGWSWFTQHFLSNENKNDSDSSANNGPSLKNECTWYTFLHFEFNFNISSTFPLYSFVYNKLNLPSALLKSFSLN